MGRIRVKLLYLRPDRIGEELLTQLIRIIRVVASASPAPSDSSTSPARFIERIRIQMKNSPNGPWCSVTWRIREITMSQSHPPAATPSPLWAESSKIRIREVTYPTPLKLPYKSEIRKRGSSASYPSNQFKMHRILRSCNPQSLAAPPTATPTTLWARSRGHSMLSARRRRLRSWLLRTGSSISKYQNNVRKNTEKKKN